MSMVTSRWTGIPPRGVAIPPVTSCYRHWDELRQNGATWLECNLLCNAMPTFFLSKLTKLANISIEKINCSQNRVRIKSKIKMMMLFWVPRLRGVAFVSPIFSNAGKFWVHFSSFIVLVDVLKVFKHRIGWLYQGFNSFLWLSVKFRECLAMTVVREDLEEK